MLEQLIDQVSGERIREHITQLEGIRHRQANPTALEKAAKYIEVELGKLDYDLDSPEFVYDGDKFRNIIATRTGNSEPNKHILVVAHYDTIAISPGADDNASGVAGLLELARVFNDASFDCTVQFAAVNLEESQCQGTLTETGLLGSKALVELAVSEGWQVQGALVLESIAFAGKDVPQKSEGLPVPGIPSTGNFIAVVGNETSAALAAGFQAAIADNNIDLETFKLLVPGNGEILPDARRSDHARFWDAGYPALMLTDTANFRNENYHHPTDTIDTLNLDFATQVCRGVAAHVATLAGLRAQ